MKLRSLALLAGASLAALAQPAFAQTEPATDQSSTSAIEGVVVTARRREEALTDIPLAVSAFSGGQLERKNIQSTSELVKITPGLNIAVAGSVANPFIVIRGASRALSGPGVPGVITYFNEVPMPTYGSLISTLDMDNIQVLKGPQGTLFGRNAVGGAILTYSRKPTYNYEGSALFDYSSFDTLRTELVANLPIVPDKLAIRAAYLYAQSGGYTHTTQVSDYGQTGTFGRTPGQIVDAHKGYDAYERQGFRLSVRFDPVDALNNLTVVDYFKDTGATNSVGDQFFPNGYTFFDGRVAAPAGVVYGNPAALGPAGAIASSLFQCTTSPLCNLRAYADYAAQQGVRHAALNTPATDGAYSKIFGISNTTTLDINEHTKLKNIFGYRTNDVLGLNDIDGTPLPIIDTQSYVRLKQVTEELQLSGDLFDNKLSYVVGGFYYKDSPNGLGGFQGLRINVFGGLNDTQSINYSTHVSKAIYGQIDYDLSDFVHGLKVTAGYRQTWDSTEGCTAFSNLGLTYYPNNDTAPMVSESQCRAAAAVTVGGVAYTNSVIPKATASQGTYTFAISYKPDEGKLFYATLRRGYRAGDYNTPKYAGTQWAFLDPVQYFKGEIVDDIEVGTKLNFKLAGAPSTFDLAMFYDKDKGFQFYESTSSITTRVANPALGVPAGVTLPSGGVVYNKADLKIKGFEVAGTTSPVSGLVLGANAAYTDVNVDQLTIPPVITAALLGSFDPTVGFGIPFVAKWQANANVEYRFPGEVWGGRLALNADYHYQTSFVVSQIVIPSYHVVNARLTLSDVMGKPVDLSLYAKNLFDETYALGSSSSTPSGVGVASRIYAPPRSFGASVRVRFGAAG
jgi:iron complex outermembrane recepter protein